MAVRSFLLALSLLVTLPLPVSAEIEIDSCGTLVPAGEVAYLTADLDCRAVEEGVLLADRARLELNGHVITADPDADRRVTRGVRCLGGSVCSVHGPGLIAGFETSGIAGTRVRVRGVTIESNGTVGIAAYEDVRAVDSVVIANGRLGIHAGGTVRLNRSFVGEHPTQGTVGAEVIERGRHRSPVVD
jgi:hypothetical protein